MPPLLRLFLLIPSLAGAFTLLVGCPVILASPATATEALSNASVLFNTSTSAVQPLAQSCFASERSPDSNDSPSGHQPCQTLALWQETLFAKDSAVPAPLPTVSSAASDLGGELVVDRLVAQQPLPAAQAAPPSDALNLPVLRSLKKPVGKKVLDTAVGIAGINPKDTSENFWTRDFLTGNWGGRRDRLLKQGIDLYLAEFADVYSNVGGGRTRNTALNNVVLAGLDLYTTKLGWWKEGQIHITAVDIRGISVGTDYSGSISSVYFVDPLVRSTRLFELWYGQKFGNNNQYEVRLGKIFPFVRIAASQTAGMFTNTSFQYPTFLGTSPKLGLIEPFAAAPFGLQLSYTPGSQWLFIGQIQDGFDDPTGGFANADGFNTRFSAREGIEGVVEAVYRPNQERGSIGLPGYYRLGFQFHSGVFKSQSLNTLGQSVALFGGDRKDVVGNHALYFTAEQMIWRESPNPRDRTQGLNVFFKTVVSPDQDSNTIALNMAGGLAYEGLIAGRDRDVLGIGIAYSRFSDGIRDFDRDNQRIHPGSAIRDAETVVELVYTAQITPWWYVVASFQRIIHPSGDAGIPRCDGAGH